MATYYADSVNGNDANDGLSWATAKASIDGALILQTSGNHVLWLRNNFIISANVTVNSANWNVRGENTASASITLNALWQSAVSPNERHYFRSLTITANVSNAFPSGNAFSDCIISSAAGVNWCGQYKRLRLLDCTVTGASASNGVDLPGLTAIRTTFNTTRIRLANNSTSSFQNCIFNGCSLDLNMDTYLNNCSFWNSSIFDRNVVSHYRNCVFAFPSGTTLCPQFQFVVTQTYISGCVRWNCTTNITAPGLVQLDNPTLLAGNPYNNPGAGDYSPSALLQAVSGVDGLVPGAIAPASVSKPLSPFTQGVIG